MSDLDPRIRGDFRYSTDFEVPGMLHGVLVRSPHARAMISGIDLSQVPGDVTTLQAADLGEVGTRRYGAAILDQPVLAGDRVRHVGEPVVAVAASSLSAARAAAERVRIEYDVEEPALGAQRAAVPGAPEVHPDLDIGKGTAASVNVRLRPVAGSNICHRFRLQQGAPDWQDLADAVITREYSIAGAAHMPMEPHVTIAYWEEDRLTVVTGTQTPFANRSGLAELFGLPETGVRIRTVPMGGSFGAKTFLRAEPITAALARKAGRPVRIAFTREEEFLTLNRHPATFRITLGATSDGRLVGKDVDIWWDTGAYADAGPDVATKGGYASIGPYRIPNVNLHSRCVYTNTVPNGAYRGYAATQASWASERCMDELAEELDLDPLEFRLANLLREGETFATGETLHDFHVEECLLASARAISWAGTPTAADACRDRPVGRPRPENAGKGVAVVMKGMHTPSRAQAALVVGDDGRVVVRTATTEFGQRVDRVQTRLAATALDAPLELFQLGENDTDLAPFDARTTSSRSVHMMSYAIGRAAEDLRSKLADKLGVAPTELVLDERDVRTTDETRPWVDFVGVRGDGEFVTEGGLDPDTGAGVASSEWHQGAAAADVEVDTETGQVTLLRLHTSAWAGTVVDRTGAELQTEGCMIMGTGTTLFEEVSSDASGQPQQSTMSDYNIPSMEDVPRLTYDLLEADDGSTVHGLGETAMPPLPAAVGNALQSLGVCARVLPLTPERVLWAADAATAVNTEGSAR